MKKITGIKVTFMFDDGNSVDGIIDPNEEFISDLHTNIRLYGANSRVVHALIFLANLGSEAITGINPKGHENAIKVHFGDTRNINVMTEVREFIYQCPVCHEDSLVTKKVFDDYGDMIIISQKCNNCGHTLMNR